jgi:hypothetical protein
MGLTEKSAEIYHQDDMSKVMMCLQRICRDTIGMMWIGEVIMCRSHWRDRRRGREIVTLFPQVCTGGSFSMVNQLKTTFFILTLFDVILYPIAMLYSFLGASAGKFLWKVSARLHWLAPEACLWPIGCDITSLNIQNDRFQPSDGCSTIHQDCQLFRI